MEQPGGYPHSQPMRRRPARFGRTCVLGELRLQGKTARAKQGAKRAADASAPNPDGRQATRRGRGGRTATEGLPAASALELPGAPPTRARKLPTSSANNIVPLNLRASFAGSHQYSPYCRRVYRGGGVYSQSTLLKRTALVAGALTAIVLTAGLFPLSLVGSPESVTHPASPPEYKRRGGEFQ